MKTQICTNKDQSEKLISLGFDKNTADMYIRSNGVIYTKETCPKKQSIKNDLTPAWSLSVLIDMLPEWVGKKEDSYTLVITKNHVGYYMVCDDDIKELNNFVEYTLLDSIIKMIEWLNEKELHDFGFLEVDYEVGDIIRLSENDVPLRYEGYRVDLEYGTTHYYTEVGEKSQYFKMSDSKCKKYGLPIGSLGICCSKVKGRIIKKAKEVCE